MPTTAIAVIASDDDLSKGHVEYLEARLIQIADDAKRATLDNKTKPDTERRCLPEADIANMENFLENLMIVLPVIGLESLRPQPKALSFESPESSMKVSAKDHSALASVQFEIRHKSGVKAVAIEEDGEFVILKDSQALTGTGYQMQSYNALKERLISEGILVTDQQERLKFTQTYAFNSPSAAAAVVLDRNSNGRKEWKRVGSTQTYQEWQDEQVSKENSGMSAGE